MMVISQVIFDSPV